MNKMYLQAENLPETREKIRTILRSPDAPEEILVTVPAAVYSPHDFVFTAEDCSPHTKITYLAESGTVITGGLTIPKKDWLLPDDEMLVRFPEESRDKIRMISLAGYGLTREEWGEEQVFGSHVTVDKYDDAPKGCGSEFFCGDKRMVKARYPNQGTYAKLEGVIDMGDAAEFPSGYNLTWKDRRNHRGGTYIVDSAVNERIKKWATPETAWIFGYFYHDWADASSPITVDPSIRAISPKYVGMFGARAGGEYYLYNVPEELDCEGEWYLERTNGNLYFYPWEGAESADFSYSPQPLISCTDTQNLTFSGFTLRCGMKDAVVVRGNDMVFENLCIKNIAEYAVTVNGYRNIVRRCDISHMGKGGIQMNGGDRRTLTHGENRVEDNRIRHISEITQTYCAGIGVGGVGNLVSHNEISHSPHLALTYSGNEHLIEYNYIHDVVLYSGDAGAIYNGLDVTAHGTVIRYNMLKDIGANGFKPMGIYFDDTLSGQTAYGNILINVGGNAFQIGGGRENVVENNLIVNSGSEAILYDDRARGGYLFGGWYSHPERHWVQIQNSFRNEEPWKSRYPRIADCHFNAEPDPDDPNFLVNPAYSSVKNNIVIASGGLYDVSDSVRKFSYVDENDLYESKTAAGYDEDAQNLSPDSPVYTEHPSFAPIPVADIGIRKEK